MQFRHFERNRVRAPARFRKPRGSLLDAAFERGTLVLDDRSRLIQLGERAAQGFNSLVCLSRLRLVPFETRAKLRGLRFHSAQVRGGGASSFGCGCGQRALLAQTLALSLRGAARFREYLSRLS